MVPPVPGPPQALPDGATGIVIFDGLCHFCDRSVQFILAHDRRGVLRFAPSQIVAARPLLARCDLPRRARHDRLIDADGCWTRSTATLRIARTLGLAVVAGRRATLAARAHCATRSTLFIAQRRLQWFGRRDACRIPTAESVQRFLPDVAPAARFSTRRTCPAHANARVSRVSYFKGVDFLRECHAARRRASSSSCAKRSATSHGRSTASTSIVTVPNQVTAEIVRRGGERHRADRSGSTSSWRSRSTTSCTRRSSASTCGSPGWARRRRGCFATSSACASRRRRRVLRSPTSSTC